MNHKYKEKANKNTYLIYLLYLQTYEILRPLFPGIVAVLRAIPDVDAHDLHRLDEKLNSHNTKPSKIDKSKRDLFKKITSRVSTFRTMS